MDFAATEDKGKGRLVTLETFIIDSFTRIGEDGIERNVGELQMGGGGTYTMLGARLFQPSSELGMIIDYTPDSLPPSMRAVLESYGKEMWFFRERTDGHATTKAVNRYRGDLRIFEYLSPARYLFPTDLLSTPWLDPPPNVLHLISDAKRLARYEDEMAAVRRVVGEEWNPIICWEPEPYDHIPENWSLFVRLGPLVDVISPNHTEALSLFSIIPSPDTSTLIQQLENAADRILALGPRIGVVIRAGSFGAYYVEAGQDKGTWVPPFYQARPGTDSHPKVVDPTGAGNGFMGALSAALGEGKSLSEAVRWGSIAASFIIEQHGMPVLTVVDGHEIWNGEDPWERLRRWQAGAHEA